jgi:hypothetical protein
MFPPWVVIHREGSQPFPSENVVSAGLMPTRHPRMDQLPLWVTQNLVAVVDYKKLLAEIGVGECFVLALYLTWGRTQKSE